MCKFLSVNSDGKGNAYYFDNKLRKRCLKGTLNYEPDSHTSIADYFGFKGAKEDKMNKYEYNPLLKKFEIDQLNTIDDSKIIKLFCEELDFKKIVPELIIKPIVHPFKDKSIIKVTKKDIALMKKWASVWDSVRDSVRAYTSSFFNLQQWKYIKHKKGVNPYRPLIELWEKGLVPSFDGKIWRLHGKDAKILWEGKVR